MRCFLIEHIITTRRILSLDSIHDTASVLEILVLLNTYWIVHWPTSISIFCKTIIRYITIILAAVLFQLVFEFIWFSLLLISIHNASEMRLVFNTLQALLSNFTWVNIFWLVLLDLVLLSRVVIVLLRLV